MNNEDRKAMQRNRMNKLECKVIPGLVSAAVPEDLQDSVQLFPVLCSVQGSELK